MNLKVKILGLEIGGKAIVILNREDAEELGIRSSGRVKVKYDNKQLTAIVNVTERITNSGTIGISEEVRSILKIKDGDAIDVNVAEFPSSLQFIKNKLNGRKLNYEEIYAIIKDVVEGNLDEIEITSFVTALDLKGIDIDEAASLTAAMVETGKTLKLNKKIIVDKHSIGGAVGDKTTLVAVPIIASLGLAIPKTSSRAITSAAGTADKAEVLMPVNLDIEQMQGIVEKTNGCIVWGGRLNLAPADDIFIKIEYPLAIDPLLLPSIMSKKRAVGTNHLLIDIPTGRGTKVKTIGDADILAKDFIELGRKLNIKTQCAITYGEQPVGYSIGPALEAKEALEILMNKKRIPDVIDKATHMAGILFEMVGKAKNGQELAEEILKSGGAEQKMREIIMHQGGDSEIKPEDIAIGEYGMDIKADKNGIILWINNHGLVELARATGCPKDKGAGILLYKKLGDSVKKGDKLFTIYSEKNRKLERSNKLLEENAVIGIGDRIEMLIHEVKDIPVHKKSFILDR